MPKSARLVLEETEIGVAQTPAELFKAILVYILAKRFISRLTTAYYGASFTGTIESAALGFITGTAAAATGVPTSSYVGFLATIGVDVAFEALNAALITCP